jgi:hypothetical protein
MSTYNRYSKFTNDGTIELVPFISIDKMPTDYYVYYKANETRLDLLSYDYYNDPNYGWLILQANPQYGSLEFKIPHNALLRIPYPLDSAIANYNNAIKTYKELYGEQ